MSGGTADGYSSGSEMWRDCSESYGQITARIMCLRYLDLQAQTKDASEREFCRELREAMSMELNLADVAVYPYSEKLAELNGKLELYNQSYRVNQLCASDIDTAIYACEYGDGTHDFKDALAALIDEYGLERVRFVLACEVRWDSVFGHYPDELYAWAREMYINEDHGSYGVRTPPAVLGEFIAYMRDTTGRTHGGELAAADMEGNSVSDKTIQFIDSDYRELFRIPDGGSINIIYPPGDGRGTITRKCEFMDECHTRIGGDDYHIHEFAARMERLGARYEPEVQLRDAELAPFAAGEEKFFTYNREEGNTCVGHISGNFGNGGDRFFSNWNDRENGRNTPEFQTELQSVVYALRQNVLKGHDAMLTYCKSHPEAKLPGEGNLEIYGFKLETDTRQYYVRCFAERDSRFTAFAYDKAAPIHEQRRDKQSILKQLREAPKQPHKPKPSGKQKRDAEL